MSYNNVGKIRQKVESIAGEAKTYDYAYDANGNRTGRTLGATAAETAFYDAQDRLTKPGGAATSSSIAPQENY